MRRISKVKAAAALTAMALLLGIVSIAPDTPGAGRLADAPVVGMVGGELVADEADAAYECASWGCAETVYYWPSAGQGKYRVDDRYVSAHWTTSQSNVSACTYLYVRRAGTNQWSSVGSDCGGPVATILFNFPYAIDSVIIRSKDNRGRWRYLTIDGPSGQW